MSQQQQELISALDRAKASFNSQHERSGYLDVYDSSLITHGFPPNLPANFEGLKMFYNALWAAFPDSHLEWNLTDTVSMMQQLGVIKTWDDNRFGSIGSQEYNVTRS